VRLSAIAGAAGVVVGFVLAVGGFWTGQTATMMAGLVLIASGVVLLFVWRWLAPIRNMGLTAPSTGESLRAMNLAADMLNRSLLRNELRGSGTRVELTLVDAEPTGDQWQHAPVYRLRLRYVPAAGGSAVQAVVRETVPVTCVPRLVAGSTWHGFADPAQPERVFVDW
jgi:hypothetical protein